MVYIILQLSISLSQLLNIGYMTRTHSFGELPSMLSKHSPNFIICLSFFVVLVK